MTFTTTSFPPFAISDAITVGLDMDSFSLPSELTVAQAARILDGTEGLIHELINAGLLTYRLDNDKRLVQRDSLLHYAREEARGHAALDELLRMFREAGMSDD